MLKYTKKIPILKQIVHKEENDTEETTAFSPLPNSNKSMDKPICKSLSLYLHLSLISKFK